VNGFKDVENRPRRTHYRGPLLIQAGLSKAKFKEDVQDDIEKRHGIRFPDELEFGGVVGIVELVDCLDRFRSPWYAPDNFAWILSNPRRLAFRECKGQLGLFHPKW
jgi:hypothetical protein